jgi:hypothetical protein
MDNDINSMFEVQTSTTIPSDQVKLEPVVEAVETTEAAATTEATTVTTETAQPETPEAEKSFFDRFTKPENTETKDGEVKQPEVQQAVSPDSEALKKELEEIKNHPAFKLLTGGKDLTGVDLKSFFKSAIGEDFSNLSDEQLIEKSLRSNPAFEKLTAEEAQEEIDKAKADLGSMSKLERLTKRDQMVNALNKDIPESELLKTLAEIQDNQKKAVDPEEYFNQKYQETFDTTFKDIETYFDETGKSLIGQKYDGYEVTAEDYETMKSALHKNSHEFNKEKVFFEYFLAATADKRVKAAEQRGYEKAQREHANPSRNDSGAPVIVTKDSSSGMKDATKEEFFAQANN